MGLHKCFWVTAFALSVGISAGFVPAMAEGPEYPQPASTTIGPAEPAVQQPLEETAAPAEAAEPQAENAPEGAEETTADDTEETVAGEEESAAGETPDENTLAPLNAKPAAGEIKPAEAPAQAQQAEQPEAETQAAEEVQTATAAGWEFDLLKSLPIEISGYEEAAQLFPETLATADQVMTVLNGTRHLALHMEAMRRAYHQLPVQQQDRLMELLHGRHREIPDDAMRFFDYGYAKVLYEDNKAGLYLLRKANDRLRTQFTSLAYAMAQAEVDLNQEAAPADVLTTRKMDVKYKLADAVALDAEAHLPGFWPTFVEVIRRISPLAAYQGFTRRDFTQAYVPYGDRVMPASESMSGNAFDEADAETCAVPEGCELKNSTDVDWDKLYRSMSVDLNDDGVEEAVHFFQNGENDFRVLAVNRKNQVLADLTSPVAPYILEDLDEDGIPEMVIRNYARNRSNPLQVYRFNDCQFTLDETVSSYFK